jgi:hypothetical protein
MVSSAFNKIEAKAENGREGCGQVSTPGQLGNAGGGIEQTYPVVPIEGSRNPVAIKAAARKAADVMQSP